MDVLIERTTLAARSTSVLDRIESLYLKALRATLLIVATILLLLALGWAAINLVRVLRSPDSVVEKTSVVTSAELVDTETPAVRPVVDGNKTPDLRQERAFYDDFVKRYFALYRAKYQPNLRSDDKRLTIGEFDDLTINTKARLAAIRDGDLDFATDRADLEAYLTVIGEASGSKTTTDRLAKYRVAKKRPVTTEVRRTRTETRKGWDSYSMSCNGWYESPIGCPVTRRVEVPYTERVTAMRYPDGISSPNEVLKAYQDRYFGLLADRRRQNSDAAQSERQEILIGQDTGWAGLSQAMLIIGAFFVLMFFFLLVAIERHQRRLTSSLPINL